MADIAGMNVVIGAKIDGAVAGLQQVDKATESTGKAMTELAADAKKATVALDKITPVSSAVSKGLATTAINAIKADSALDKVGKTGVKSTKDFSGLSRVIQDLPFGFIGIQNNITQLLPAAGALGLALSLITSAVTFAQVGFSAWTRGLDGNKNKVDEAAEAIKKAKEDLDSFNSSLKSAESSALSQGVALQEYVKIARDSTKSLDERNFALKEANKIMGEHGEKLTLININTAAATEEINKFTQALIQQALASKFADRISDLIIRQKDQLADYKKALDDVNKSREALRIPGAQDVLDLYDKLKKSYRDQNTTADAYNATLAELKLRMRQMSEATAQSVDLFADLGTKSKETGRHLKTVDDILKELNKKFEVFNAFEDNQGLDKAEDKIKAIEDAIKQLIEIGQDPNNGLIQNLFGGIGDIALPWVGRMIDEFNRKLKVTPIEAPLEIKDIDFVINKEAVTRAINAAKVEIGSVLAGISLPANFKFLSDAELESAAKSLSEGLKFALEQGFKLPDNFNILSDEDKQKLFDSFKQIETITSQLTSDIFSKIAENVGTFKNPFADIFKILGDSLVKLGIYVITSSKLVASITKALNSALSGVGGAGIAVGIGLIAIGTIMKNIPKLATGGIVPAGYPNDSFPAMLQSNEAVIPLDKLRNYMPGNANQIFIPSLRISNNELVIAFQRANKRYNQKY